MGPRTCGNDVMSGLKKGALVGVIASGDNHVVPAMYGNGSILNGLIEKAKELTFNTWGISEYYRSVPFWHNAYKFKINQGVIEEAYKKKYTYTTNILKTNRDFFMVKVHQKNGEIAWSSPTWIEKKN